MNKKVWILIWVWLAIFGLSACSGSGAEPVSTQSDSEPSPVSTAPIESAAATTPENQPAVTEAPSPTPDSLTKDGIWIRYVGNACYYIIFPDGTRLVTDPYSSNYNALFCPFPEIEADVITLSHLHDDHNGTNAVKGTPEVIKPDRRNEVINVGAVEITGYPSKHVANMGENTIFVFEYEDYKVVHMGETDNIDSENALEAIRDADILLMYAGEYGDVKNDAIFKFAADMNIKVLTPQHYSMDPEHLWYNQSSISMILDELPEDMTVIEADDLIVKQDMEAKFVVLNPMCKK